MFKNISFRQLQVFKRISETGTFTAAAKELYLTQPTVSILMKKLENAVGTPLFEQIGRRTHLTKAGEEFRRLCCDMFLQIDSFEDFLATEKGVLNGTVRLAGVTTTECFAPLLLKQFQNIFPSINVQLNIADTESINQRMCSNYDDLYLIDKMPDDIEVVLVPLFTDSLVVIADQSHHLNNNDTVSLQHLENQNFILREANSGARTVIDKFFQKNGIKLQVGLELSCNEGLKQAVSEGMGLSIISKHAITPKCTVNGLVVLQCDGFPLTQPWYLAYPKDKYLSPAVDQLLRFILSTGKRELEQSCHQLF